MRKFVLLAAFLAVSSCNTIEEVNQRLLEAFEDVVFSLAPDRKADKVTQRNPYMVRWEGPISYNIQWEGNKDPEFDATIREKMKKIAGIANRPIRWEEAEASANIVVFVNDREANYRINGGEHALCYANIEGIFEEGNESEEDGVLKIANMYLPGKRLDVANECLEHEILHIFGFWGHTQKIRSVMSVFRKDDDMTKWDVLLLRALYHPELEPGLDRDETIRRADAILADLLANG